MDNCTISGTDVPWFWKQFGRYHKLMYDLQYVDCRIVETQRIDVISTINAFAVHWGLVGEIVWIIV